MQKFLKGILFMALVLIPVIVVMSTLEYNLYFGQTIRKVLFWIFILGALGLLGYWIVYPLYQYLMVHQRLDNKKAAILIGQHFPEVEDKLLNVLNLNEMSISSHSRDLIAASIAQKSEKLAIVKFNEAIDWAANWRLGKYLALPLLILLFLMIYSPSLLRDSTYRFVNYNTAFSPPAPFDFHLLTHNLKIPQYESIKIKANLSGKTLPKGLNISYKGVLLPMAKEADDIYSIVLENIEESADFKLEALGFYSREYTIDVVPRPIINKMEVRISPPAYTGLPSTSQVDIGDINAPEGSVISWKINVSHTDKVVFRLGQKLYEASHFLNGYGLSYTARHSGNYSIGIQNSQAKFVDSQSYSITTIQDAPPLISVNQFVDSIEDIMYYAGDVSDDYGLGKLYIVVRHNNLLTKFSIPYSQGKSASFEFSTRKIFEKYPKGADLAYYFEIWDNDAVNGSKSTQSQNFQYNKKSDKEIQQVLDKNTNQLQKDMLNSIKEAKDFQKKIEEIKKTMLEKSSLDYGDKNKIQELLKQQEALQKKLEDTKDEIKRNFDKKNELNEQEKNIQEQQKQLEEIADQMKSPQLEELLKKIQELLEKNDKKEILQNVKKLDIRSEKLEKNMDRLLQLYKQLDYKQKLNDMIDKLDELAKKQEAEANKNEPKEKSLQEQKELTKELKETEKKLDELKKINEEVNKSDKKEFEEIQEEVKDAEEMQEQSEEEMKKGNEDNAKKAQKSAAKKMKSASDKMKSLKKSQKKKQKAEDARMMRRVLENIIYLSFEQEKIVEATKTTRIDAPAYLNIVRHQKKILEDFEIVEDTLYKIASRQPVVKKMIFEEIDKITENSQSSIEKLAARNPQGAISNEQFAMSSYNKLGLMISESLKNMEENEDDGPEGSDGMCENPGGKGKKKSMSMSKLAEMQQQLNEQMEGLKKKMDEQGNPKGDKEGGNEGDKKSDKGGEKGSQGDGMAKEFARIAAQQQAIRNALQKIEQNANNPDKAGNKPLGNGLNEMMEKMKETEKELYNKKVLQEMINRQKDIQVKMLESAKALKEQEEETRRESEKAKSTPPDLPPALKRYIEDKKKNEVPINKSLIQLSPYFKSLSDKYFQLIK